MADPHVITALNRKYAELKGHLDRHSNEAKKLRKSMAHVEATIRLFRDDYASDMVVSADFHPA
jgi:hypothetical protein